VQHANGELVVGPPGAFVLDTGDRLMMLSSESDLETLGRPGDGARAT
jgi:hypothetical protein